jgi:hypothetical protein
VFGIARRQSNVPPLFVVHRGIVKGGDPKAGMVEIDDGGKTPVIVMLRHLHPTEWSAKSAVLAMSKEGHKSFQVANAETPDKAPERMVDVWSQQVMLAEQGGIPVVGYYGYDGKLLSPRQRRKAQRQMREVFGKGVGDM